MTDVQKQRKMRKKYQQHQKMETNLIQYNQSFFLSKLNDCRAYKLLFENIISKDEKLPEDTLKEIREVIEQTGGESEFTMTTEEIKEMRKERKEELKKKKQMKFTPLDDDWRGQMLF